MFQADIRDNSENEKVQGCACGLLTRDGFQGERPEDEVRTMGKLSQKCILSGSGEPVISLIIQG